MFHRQASSVLGFAGLDEYHQSFVSGRTPAIKEAFVLTAEAH